jgi:hypothetical protein
MTFSRMIFTEVEEIQASSRIWTDAIETKENRDRALVAYNENYVISALSKFDGPAWLTSERGA